MPRRGEAPASRRLGDACRSDLFRASGRRPMDRHFSRLFGGFEVPSLNMRTPRERQAATAIPAQTWQSFGVFLIRSSGALTECRAKTRTKHRESRADATGRRTARNLIN